MGKKNFPKCPVCGRNIKNKRQSYKNLTGEVVLESLRCKSCGEILIDKHKDILTIRKKLHKKKRR